MTIITYRSPIADRSVDDTIHPATSILQRISRFMDEWIHYSYEAWVKAGRPNSY